MTGFSPSWLALREPADHAAVNAGVRAAFAAHVARHEQVTIMDLGCGTGSHLRSLAPHLGLRQSWLLVDYDANLLDAARETLGRWAQQSEARGEGLSLHRDGRRIEVTFLRADLAADLESVLDQPCDAVTSAAFFDLVSPDFINRLAGAMSARGLPLYTILTYDGREIWSPRSEADESMLSAFNLHQASDKGFGAAAGPAAGALLRRAFEASGYDVVAGESPWKLGAPDRRLMVELAQGVAHAVGETGRVPPRQIAAWLASHAGADSCEIGHLDIFARPS